MNTVHSFHGGAPLNLWERCSLQSFADHGHEIILFSYDRCDLPRGVRLESAADIISIEERDKFFALAPGSYAQFSDLFRYELLNRHGGWWVDTDVLCRSSTLPSHAVVMGETRPGKLCNAIMRFPPRHQLLGAACNYCRSHQHTLAQSHRTLFGPMLMSDLMKSDPITVSEIELFYPIRGRNVWKLGEPQSASAVKFAVESSPMVHWFQEFFRAAGLPRDLLPPAGSFLADAFVSHGGVNAGHMSLDQYRAHAPDKKKVRTARKNKKHARRKKGLLRSLWSWVRGSRRQV